MPLAKYTTATSRGRARHSSRPADAETTRDDGSSVTRLLFGRHDFSNQGKQTPLPDSRRREWSAHDQVVCASAMADAGVATRF